MSLSLRIALVSDCYYPDVGGIPEHVHHLGRFLLRRGHRVAVVTTRFPQHLPLPAGDGEPEVLRLGRASAPLIENGAVARTAVGLRLGRELRALFLDRRFDVVHVHGLPFPVLPLLAVRHAPRAALLVATFHSHFPDAPALRLFRRPLQRYLDALDGAIAVSPSALDSLSRVGLQAPGTPIIENGVDLDYWGAGRRLRAPGDAALQLLVQARLEPRNDVATVLSALAQARRELPALRLTVVGDGPLFGALLGHRHYDPAAVRLCGARLADRNDFAASCDIYCFTARIASHPVSLLEGLAAGRPVLAPDSVDSGCRGLVRDGCEGFLLPPGDAAAWARALLRLGHDGELRRRMGMAARRRAQEFSWDRIGARIEARYLELRQGRHGPPGGGNVDGGRRSGY